MVKTLIIGLLTFFIIFWGMPRFLRWFIPWILRRQVDKFVNAQQRQAEAQARAYYDAFDRMHQQGTAHNAKSRRSTVFGSDDGEYVEYEEIEAAVTETRVTYNGDPEPQITDADWEEI